VIFKLDSYLERGHCASFSIHVLFAYRDSLNGREVAKNVLFLETIGEFQIFSFGFMLFQPIPTLKGYFLGQKMRMVCEKWSDWVEISVISTQIWQRETVRIIRIQKIIEKFTLWAYLTVTTLLCGQGGLCCLVLLLDKDTKQSSLIIL